MERSPNIPRNVLSTALRRMHKGRIAAYGPMGFGPRAGRMAKAVLHHQPAFDELLARFEGWIRDGRGPERHDELVRWLWANCRDALVTGVGDMVRIYDLKVEPPPEAAA